MNSAEDRTEVSPSESETFWVFWVFRIVSRSFASFLLIIILYNYKTKELQKCQDLKLLLEIQANQ